VTAKPTGYAVLLRAVNLGSHNKVAMPKLRELLAERGYPDVQTYVQSGNIVLSGTSPAAVEADVVAALRDGFGLDIEVMIRSRADLAKVVKGNPFLEPAEDPTRVHVNFLAAQPAKDKVAALDPEEFDPERFAVGDRCLYQFYPGGFGRSKMAAAPWERRLGVRGTNRNWRTVTALLDMLDR